jgi:hypothetical protein
VEKDPDYAVFFTPSPREGHAMFDLPGLTVDRLADAGVTAESLDLCTYADEERFSPTGGPRIAASRITAGRFLQYPYGRMTWHCILRRTNSTHGATG